MQQKPLSAKNVIETSVNLTRFVQNAKIDLSRTAITKFQYGNRWPDEYLSFVGRGNNTQSGTDNPEAFFGRMSRRPDLYKLPFRFLPIIPLNYELIREAALFARSIVEQQAKPFRDTGAYQAAMRYVGFDDPQGTFYEIYNPIIYGGALEAIATHYGRRQGILYYAAQRTKRKYPDVAVNFGYVSASEAGLPHKYDYPSLTIADRTQLIDNIVRPGRRLKKRKRSRAAKTAREQRLEARRLARIAAGASGDYG